MSIINIKMVKYIKRKSIKPYKKDKIARKAVIAGTVALGILGTGAGVYYGLKKMKNKNNRPEVKKLLTSANIDIQMEPLENDMRQQQKDIIEERQRKEAEEVKLQIQQIQRERQRKETEKFKIQIQQIQRERQRKEEEKVEMKLQQIQRERNVIEERQRKETEEVEMKLQQIQRERNVIEEQKKKERKETIELFRKVLKHLHVSSDKYSEETFCEHYDRYMAFINKSCSLSYGANRPRCIQRVINIKDHNKITDLHKQKCKTKK